MFKWSALRFPLTDGFRKWLLYDNGDAVVHDAALVGVVVSYRVGGTFGLDLNAIFADTTRGEFLLNLNGALARESNIVGFGAAVSAILVDGGCLWR